MSGNSLEDDDGGGNGDEDHVLFFIDLSCAKHCSKYFTYII